MFFMHTNIYNFIIILYTVTSRPKQFFFKFIQKLIYNNSVKPAGLWSVPLHTSRPIKTTIQLNIKQNNYCAPRCYLASGFLLRAWRPIVFCSHFSWPHTYMIYLYIRFIHYTRVCTSSPRPIPTILSRYPNGAARSGIFEGHVFVTLSSCRDARTLHRVGNKKNKGWRIQKNTRVPQTAGGRFRATILSWYKRRVLTIRMFIYIIILL